ncbi:MAG: fibronectin type III domain-containing protein [Ignavibacteriales bacterium]|nr:fibronectin type III domain-containing protein [Ignavibacteriales bacterium]
MKNWVITKKTLPLLFSVLIFINQSCADLSTEPNKNINQTNSKIQISSPSNNGTLMEGSSEIIYSISQPFAIKFLELYIDGAFNKNIPPNNDGSAPIISIQFDSTYIDKKINLYLIYYDNDGTSEKSNIVSNVLVTNDSRVPYTPYNVSLLKLNDGSVNISWKDSSRNVESYELWRKIDFNGEYLRHQQLSGKSNNTNDEIIDTTKIYFYKLRGFKSSGFSDFSNEINSAGISTFGNLYPPTNLSANVTGISNVNLSWIDNSNNENYFSVERSTNNTEFNKIAALVKNTTTFVDTGNRLTIGLTYYYRIAAYSNEDSAFSNTASIKITSGILVPPTNLTANYNSTVNVIQLNWSSTDNNILYFDIERKTDSGNFALLRRIAAGNNLYLDFNIQTNKTFTYRIRGYDLNRYSEYSNEVVISTF